MKLDCNLDPESLKNSQFFSLISISQPYRFHALCPKQKLHLLVCDSELPTYLLADYTCPNEEGTQHTPIITKVLPWANPLSIRAVCQYWE